MSSSSSASGSSSSASGGLTGYSLGIVFIIVVAVIWAGASVLTQWIYNSLDFQSPFLVTYISTALFSLYLPLWRLWVWLGYVKDPPFRRQHHHHHHQKQKQGDRSQSRGDSQTYQALFSSSSSPDGTGGVIETDSEGEGEDESEGVVEGLLEGAAEVVCGLVSRSLSMGADSISNNNNSNNNSSSSSSTNNSSSGSYAPLPSEEGCSQDLSLPPCNTNNNTNTTTNKEATPSHSHSHEEVMVVALKVAPLWFLANCGYNYSLLLTSVGSSTIIRSGHSLTHSLTH